MAGQLPADMVKAGARHRSDRAPASITFEWLAAESTKLERILRMQYVRHGEVATGREPLPADMETVLSQAPLGTSTTTALRRWAALKHLYMVRSQRLVAASEAGVAEETKALLRRDPVAITLSNGRQVAVTSRSYAAAYAIARHWARIQMLDAELDLVAGMFEATLVRVRRERPWRRGRWLLRRRLRRLEELSRHTYLEMAAQRQAIYAHAFTETGKPATSLQEAPAWWVEIDPTDDVAILDALAQAGPGRWVRVQAAITEARRQRADGGDDEPEPWQTGWGSLFAAIERETNMRPAECYDRDLYQLLAWAHQVPEPKPRKGDG